MCPCCWGVNLLDPQQTPTPWAGACLSVCILIVTHLLQCLDSHPTPGGLFQPSFLPLLSHSFRVWAEQVQTSFSKSTVGSDASRGICCASQRIIGVESSGWRNSSQGSRHGGLGARVVAVRLRGSPVTLCGGHLVPGITLILRGPTSQPLVLSSGEQWWSEPQGTGVLSIAHR